MRILGHRGARLVAPENTLEAFRAALAEGADGVELDVRQTADAVLVCFHDSGLGRTTDGRGPLRDRTMAELLALDAGSWFDGGSPSRVAGGRVPRVAGALVQQRPTDPRFCGLRVPTLAEVLDSLPATALVDVEVKVRGEGPQGPKEVAALVAGVLAGRADTGRVMVTSFSRRVAAAAAAELPGVRAGLVSPSFIPLGRALRAAQAADCSVLAAHAAAYFGPKARSTASRALDEGMLLAAWTVDEPETARRLADMGVAVLVSDQPGRLRLALGR